MTSFSGGLLAGRMAYAPEPADAIDAVVLAAATAKTYQIPAGASVLVFGASGDFWARFGIAGTAIAIPIADVTDGSAPEFCPAARKVPAWATHVKLIAAAACVVSISRFAG